MYGGICEPVRGYFNQVTDGESTIYDAEFYQFTS